MSETLERGAEIGGYRVDEELGRGGMGVVYRATHVHLGRVAALKVLAPWLQGNARARERFLRECRLAAELDHPNVVTVYDAGEEGDRLYVAMRLVEGGDLHDEIVASGRLEPERTAAVLDQIAGALDAAHAAGLVHRDVKPSNVMVEGERAYLTDFGLTRPMEQGVGGVTRTGEFMGTIEWASPEQITHGELTPRTDVYALGCLAFACLTGRTPYVAESPADMLWQHVHGPPPQLADVRRDLPAALQGAIDGATAKDPAQRYASAGDFAAAFRAAAGLGGAAPPRGPGGRSVAAAPARSRRRRRVLLAVLGALALAAAVAVGIVLAAGGDDGGGDDRIARVQAAARYEGAVAASDAAFDQEIERLTAAGGAGGAAADAIARFVALEDAVKRRADRLEALEPPPAVARDHQVLVDGYRLLEEEIGDAIAAARAGDRAALRRLERRYDEGTSAAARQIDRATQRIQREIRVEEES